MDAETREAFAEMRRTLMDMRAEIAQVRTDLGAQIAQVRTDLSAATGSLEVRVAALERQVTLQGTELVNTTKLFGVIGETVSDLVHENAEMRHAVQTLSERVAPRFVAENLDMRTGDLERHTALEARLTRVERELAELRALLQ